MDKISVIYLRERFLTYFPDMFKDENAGTLLTCIDDIYAMFPGIVELWMHLDCKIWKEKTDLCYAYLVAWYIADNHPELCYGVQSKGAVPVAEKRIGDVMIRYAYKSDTRYTKEDALEDLKSNQFGLKAYWMIKKSGKRATFIKVGT